MKEIKTKVEKICIDAKKATESLANLVTSIKNKIFHQKQYSIEFGDYYSQKK
mgnify:CR=1 FL=1